MSVADLENAFNQLRFSGAYVEEVEERRQWVMEKFQDGDQDLDRSPDLLTDWEESAHLGMMLIKGEACIVDGKLVHQEQRDWTEVVTQYLEDTAAKMSEFIDRVSTEDLVENPLRGCLFAIAPFLEGKELKELRCASKSMLLSSYDAKVSTHLKIGVSPDFIYDTNALQNSQPNTAPITEGESIPLSLDRFAHFGSLAITVSHAPYDFSSVSLSRVKMIDVPQYIAPKMLPEEVHVCGRSTDIEEEEADSDDTTAVLRVPMRHGGLRKLTIEAPMCTYDLTDLNLNYLEVTTTPRTGGLFGSTATARTGGLFGSGGFGGNTAAVGRTGGDSNICAIIPPRTGPETVKLNMCQGAWINELLRLSEIKNLTIDVPSLAHEVPTFDLSELSLDRLELQNVTSIILPPTGPKDLTLTRCTLPSDIIRLEGIKKLRIVSIFINQGGGLFGPAPNQNRDRTIDLSGIEFEELHLEDINHRVRVDRTDAISLKLSNCQGNWIKDITRSNKINRLALTQTSTSLNHDEQKDLEGDALMRQRVAQKEPFDLSHLTLSYLNLTHVNDEVLLREVPEEMKVERSCVIFPRKSRKLL